MNCFCLFMFICTFALIFTELTYSERSGGAPLVRSKRGLLKKLEKKVRKSLRRKIIKTNGGEEDPEVTKIKNMCKKMDCKKQTEAAKASRRKMVDMIMHRRMAKHSDQSEADAKTKAEQQIAAVQRAKMAVIKSMGLTNIVTPSDDGLWDGDIILSKEQAEGIIASINEEVTSSRSSATDAVRQSIIQSRKRRDVIFMESFASFKWDLPIPYKIVGEPPHFVFTKEERQAIENAIKDIESKTCIRFVESKAEYAIAFSLTSSQPGKCGAANKGRQDYNEVFLSRDCSKDFTGVVIHEILHVLGFAHTHNRVDRDDYIDIKKENMNPQNLVAIHKDDKLKFTSYGVPYDYHSILHYGPKDLSVNDKDVFIALRKPTSYFQSAMGRRTGGLSSRDAEMIRKAYCQPTCQDKHVWCGFWKNRGYCNEAQGFFDLMKTTCMKSCDFC